MKSDGTVLPYVERAINGSMYRSYTLRIGDWAELTEKLGAMLGDPLASILRGDAALPNDMALGASDFVAVAGDVVKRLQARQIMELVGLMSKSLHVEGRANTSNDFFWAQHMRDLAPATALFLEAQYSDFWQGLSDVLPESGPELPDPSESVSGE